MHHFCLRPESSADLVFVNRCEACPSLLGACLCGFRAVFRFGAWGSGLGFYGPFIVRERVDVVCRVSKTGVVGQNRQWGSGYAKSPRRD